VSRPLLVCKCVWYVVPACFVIHGIQAVEFTSGFMLCDACSVSFELTIFMTVIFGLNDVVLHLTKPVYYAYLADLSLAVVNWMIHPRNIRQPSIIRVCYAEGSRLNVLTGGKTQWRVIPTYS